MTRPVPTLAILFAGGAGYYIFLLAVEKSARQIVRWVVLPAIAGISIMSFWSARAFHLGGGGFAPESAAPKPFFSSLIILARDLGPGLHIALAGLFLVGLAVWRIRNAPAAGAESAGETRDVCRFAWAMLTFSIPAGELLVLAALSVMAGALWSLLGAHVPPHWIREMVVGSRRVFMAAPVALIAAWMMGANRWKTLLSLLRPRRPGILALGVSIPVLVHWIPKIAFYLGARFHWNPDAGGVAIPPSVVEYLQPARWQWDLLRFPAAALLTEIGWRGYGLRKFVERFGLHGGIVLLGIMWGAIAYPLNWVSVVVRGGTTAPLAGSLILGVVVSYPLAWLMMRSGSVLPSTLAVGLGGMLAAMAEGESFPVQGWLASHSLVVALWAAVGVILFRYFGVEAEVQRGSGISART